MQETITHTTEVFKGRIVHLQVHDVRLSNGEMSKREVIHHQGAVAIVVTDDEHHVLLVKQFRLPVGKAIWEIPAGTLEPNEEPEACAIRELQEETGYKPLNLVQLGGIHPAPGYTTEFIYLFWAREIVESRLEGDADELIEAHWRPLAETLDMITTGDITDSKTIAGLLRVARELGV